MARYLLFFLVAFAPCWAQADPNVVIPADAGKEEPPSPCQPNPQVEGEGCGPTSNLSPEEGGEVEGGVRLPNSGITAQEALQKAMESSRTQLPVGVRSSRPPQDIMDRLNSPRIVNQQGRGRRKDGCDLACRAKRSAAWLKEGVAALFSAATIATP